MSAFARVPPVSDGPQRFLKSNSRFQPAAAGRQNGCRQSWSAGSGSRLRIDSDFRLLRDLKGRKAAVFLAHRDAFTGVMRYSHPGSKLLVKNKALVSAMKSYILRG
jgi:hypothetical protein